MRVRHLRSGASVALADTFISPAVCIAGSLPEARTSVCDDRAGSASAEAGTAPTTRLAKPRGCPTGRHKSGAGRRRGGAGRPHAGSPRPWQTPAAHGRTTAPATLGRSDDVHSLFLHQARGGWGSGGSGLNPSTSFFFVRFGSASLNPTLKKKSF